MLLYTASLSDFSEEDYNKYHSLQSVERKSAIAAKSIENDRRRSVLGEALARKGISEICGIDERDILFSRYENQKPYCTNAQVFFSISHSKDRVICAVSRYEVGADTEQIRFTEPRVMRACCADTDFEYILGGRDIPNEFTPDQLKRFFMLWTAKEAYCKYVGIGVTGMKRITLAEIEKSTIIFESDGYVTAVYSPKNDLSLEIKEMSAK